MTRCATEFLLHPTPSKIQVINAFLNPVHDQLKRFDIYNSMCAFNSDTITYPENLYTLEEFKILHVHQWRKWTMSRVFKYLSRKNYRLLSERTVEVILKRVIEAHEIISKNSKTVTLASVNTEDEKPKRPIDFIEKAIMENRSGVLKFKIKNILSSFSNEQVLLLGECGLDTYGGLREISRRLTEDVF